MNKEDNNTVPMPNRKKAEETPEVIELPGEAEVVEDAEGVDDVAPGLPEDEAIGSYQVVLSVLVNGDLTGITDDPAHRNLVNGLVVKVDEIRTNFPGKILAATITEAIIGTEERSI